MATNITNTSVTTDDLTVNTNKLFVDGSTDLIGIGTTSPATATGGGIDIHKGGGSSVRIDDTSNSVTGELQVYSAGLNLATVTNHGLIFSTNNTERMRIHSNGLVTTPNSLAVSSYLNTTHTHNGSGANKVTNWTQAIGTSGPTFPSTRHHNSFDYTNSRFVAPVTGIYMMVYKPDYTVTLTTNHYISFGINGASRSFDVVEDQPQYANSGTNYQAYLHLNANDYVELYTQGGVTYGLRGGPGHQYHTWWFILQLA